MKLVRVEYPLVGGGKVLFYFASEERIDFRDLVKDLAPRVHARIEMRQIGARDEAKMVGGIGSCGRELCCSTWLPAFVPVSIKMAKDQGLRAQPDEGVGPVRAPQVLPGLRARPVQGDAQGPAQGGQARHHAGRRRQGRRARRAAPEACASGSTRAAPRSSRPTCSRCWSPPPQPGRGGKLPVVPPDDET